MKHLQQLIPGVLLMLCCHLSLPAQISGDYDPNNPPEPQNLFALTLQPNNPAAGSVSGAGSYAEGVQKWVYAYANSGFRFLHWKEKDVILSTSYNLLYTMPARPVTLTAHYIYDPANPGEPNVIARRYRVNFSADPTGGGYFNYSTYENAVGTNFNCYAYPYSGYVFKGWYSADTLISTTTPLNFQVRDRDVNIVGKFAWQPGNPGEPNPGTTVLNYLSTLTQTLEKGKTVPFNVYLTNQNNDIAGADFQINFPEGVEINALNCALSSRQNGHTLQVTKVNDTLPNYLFNIRNVNTGDYIFGNSGILMTIPVTLTSDWVAGTSHPVTFVNTSLIINGDTLNCPAKNGSLVALQETSTLFASFFPDIFLNRVYFRNLSSEGIESYRWNFGDGQTSTEKEPLHSYAASGAYTVKLQVTKADKTDSIEQQIIISDVSTWTLSGNFTLNQSVKGVKNFTTLSEMYNHFYRGRITGNLQVQVMQGQNFDLAVDQVHAVLMDDLFEHLNSSGYTLSLTGSASGLEVPTMSYSGNFPQDILNSLLKTWSKTQTSGIETQLLGKALDVNVLNQMKYQLACSGSPTTAVDFSNISPAIAFSWSVRPGQQHHITGYPDSGTQVIASTTLTNDSTGLDKIIYDLYGNFGPGMDYWLSDYEFRVAATIKGVITDMKPLNNQLIESVNVNFSWNSQQTDDTSFDIYIWEKGSSTPTEPIISGIKDRSNYSNSSFCKYGKAYYWKVMARTSCNSIVSPVDSFVIRTLPDLQVTEITYPEVMYAGDQIVVKAKIMNAGGNVDMGWVNNELLMAKNGALDGLKSIKTLWMHGVIQTGDTLELNFEITIPVDTIPYTRFVVKTDIHNSLLESDELNNMLVSNPMQLIMPQIDAHDYDMLRQFNQQAAGSYWNTKWKTSSNVMIAANWPGVTFNRGFVTGISLRNNSISGKLPKAIFSLPKLNSLDLYGNQLEANLSQFRDSLLGLNILADSLGTLNLGKNMLTGEISPFAAIFPKLEDLTLSYASLSLAQPLSARISHLDLNYQQFEMDTFDLSVTPQFTLPPICRYVHQGRHFNGNPYINLYLGNQHIGSINYWSGYYRMGWNDAAGWRVGNDDDVKIVLADGHAWGSTATTRIKHILGDANVDKLVSVLDVQQTLNKVLQENPVPFNFRAADTFVDDVMTVQDIVSTINILIEDTLTVGPLGVPMKIKAEDAPNTLEMDGSYVKLNAEDEISAIDLSLKNVKSTQLRLLLNNNDFQLVSKDNAEGVRLVIFSPTGASIPTGIKKLLEVFAAAPEIADVSCSDRQAVAVPCRIVQSPSSTSNPLLSGLNAWFSEGKIRMQTPVYADELQASLFNLQGMLIGREDFSFLPAGNYNTLRQFVPEAGIYLLRIHLCNGENYVDQTFRIIINK